MDPVEHPRKLVRGAFVDALKTPVDGEYPTDSGERVEDSRDIPLKPGKLPATIIYTTGETIDADTRQTGGIRRRRMTLRCEHYHAGDDGAAAVDRLAWQTEITINKDETLGGMVESCQLAGTDLAFAEGAEFALHAAVMDFEVVYCTHQIEVEGSTPVTVLLGFDPFTGPGHEDDYIEVGEVSGAA